MEYMHISEFNFGPLRIHLQSISLHSYLPNIIVEYLTSNVLHRVVHSIVSTFPLRGHLAQCNTFYIFMNAVHSSLVHFVQSMHFHSFDL